MQNLICTYTLMETSKNTTLHSETINKREVQNKSPNMEREAVDCALKKLKEWVNVVEITTDSSTSVTKMLGMLFYVFTILVYLCMANCSGQTPQSIALDGYMAQSQAVEESFE